MTPFLSLLIMILSYELCVLIGRDYGPIAFVPFADLD
jgi:hypothetical protein